MDEVKVDVERQVSEVDILPRTAGPKPHRTPNGAIRVRTAQSHCTHQLCLLPQTVVRQH